MPTSRSITEDSFSALAKNAHRFEPPRDPVASAERRLPSRRLSAASPYNIQLSTLRRKKSLGGSSNHRRNLTKLLNQKLEIWIEEDRLFQDSVRYDASAESLASCCSTATCGSSTGRRKSSEEKRFRNTTLIHKCQKFGVVF